MQWGSTTVGLWRAAVPRVAMGVAINVLAQCPSACFQLFSIRSKDQALRVPSAPSANCYCWENHGFSSDEIWIQEMEESMWPPSLSLSPLTRSETGNLGTLASSHAVHTLNTAHSSLYPPHSEQGMDLRTPMLWQYPLSKFCLV